MKFLLDNNISPLIARSLNILSEPEGYPVFHLRDKFAPSTKDPEWISVLSKEKEWAVVSHDRFKAEKEALRRSGLIVFCLAKNWQNQILWDQAYTLMRWWPRIIETSEDFLPPAAFDVPYRFSGSGRLKQSTLLP